MLKRRARTLMDQILQPPGTPNSQDKLRARIEYYENLLLADAALDLAKWGTAAWVPSSPLRNLTNEVGRIKNDYLPGRRAYLYVSQVNAGNIATEQPAGANLQIGAVDFNPVGGNQAHEYVELLNTNSYALDISLWQLTGAIDFTFMPGTVIPAGTRLYVSPDVKAFRTRTASPKAGERRFVVGPYKGQLSARGETLMLLEPSGRTNFSLTYPGNPSLAQQFLRITEVMYNPAPGGAYPASEYEYLELRNISTTIPLNLAGIRLANGVDFDFSTGAVTQLPPGQRLLVVKNPAAFTSRYGSNIVLAGVFSGSLDNAGERLQLLDANGEEILDFTYNNSWYPLTDGLGFSLMVADEQATPDAWNNRGNWRANSTLHGTPGSDEPLGLIPPTVVINEVLAHTDPPLEDSVELYNYGTSVIDISGWLLTDDLALPRKYRIPPSTLLAPGAYVVFKETDFNANGTGFSLSSTGDGVYLFSADAADNLTGYLHGFAFGPTENGRSLGRHVNTMGEEELVPEASLSLGTNNAGPLVGPVVISEIMFHPVAISGNTNPTAYVELLNLAATNVPLFTLAEPTNAWRLRSAVDYDFPVNTWLAPAESVLVCGFDPATNLTALQSLRSLYGIPAATRIFGPWSGSLPNDQGVVELQKPDLANSNNVPYALVERVHYRDTGPWPALADGTGAGLTRVTPSLYGNEPTNWIAARPTPGTNYLVTQPPSIVIQPSSLKLVLGSSSNLMVAVTGNGPFGYQWKYHGVNVEGATNAQLGLAPVQYAHAGAYQVLIMSPEGVVASEWATVLVQAAAGFTTQPSILTMLFPYQSTNLNAVIKGDATRAQWFFNGAPLPGATGSSLSLFNVQPTNAGNYVLMVSNEVSVATSQTAVVSVRLQPLIMEQPRSLSVFAGSNTTLSVTAVSTTPLRYQWRQAGVNLPNATNVTYAITGAQEAQAGTYDVMVADNFGTTVSDSVVVEVKTRPIIMKGPFPTNLVVLVGTPVTYAIEVNGALPMNFRWRKNGFSILTNMLLSETTSVFSITGTLTNNAGYYEVLITNTFGSTPLSGRTYLTVMEPLTNQMLVPGSNPAFKLVCVPSSPGAGLTTMAFKYQWSFNGTNLNNATNATLTVTNAQMENVGAYTVVATNQVGTMASQTAYLYVNEPPGWVFTPTNLLLDVGAEARFAGLAMGGGQITYQWRFNETSLLGETNSTLVITNAQSSSAGSYQLVARNLAGAITSAPAWLSLGEAPVVTVQPQSAEILAGTNYSLSVTASGTPPLFFQWQHNQQPLADATNATLVLTNANSSQVGAYYVVITNTSGATTSQVARLFLAGADQDGDGLSDWQEYRLGTNPQDAHSSFKVAITGPDASIQQITLTFEVLAGHSYSIQRNESFGLNSWQNLTNVTDVASNQTMQVYYSLPTGGNRFYRLTSPATQF
jgi:hypothetical protein